MNVSRVVSYVGPLQPSYYGLYRGAGFYTSIKGDRPDHGAGIPGQKALNTLFQQAKIRTGDAHPLSPNFIGEAAEIRIPLPELLNSKKKETPRESVADMAGPAAGPAPAAAGADEGAEAGPETAKPQFGKAAKGGAKYVSPSAIWRALPRLNFDPMRPHDQFVLSSARKKLLQNDA